MKRLGFVLIVVCCASASAIESPSTENIAFFESRIRPVLVESCYQCHSTKALQAGGLQGGLLLDSRDGIRKGGESGPAVVPMDPKSSLLISAIRHDGLEMPPKSKLPKDVINDFLKWVEMGAPDPRDGATAAVEQNDVDVDSGRTFWSFLPLRNDAPPNVRNTDWVVTDIDHFILARLEEQNITPNGTADRITLIRRLNFDICGLPPVREDVVAYVNDTSPAAWSKLIDRLLESPHYGERWARHWLDLARFAESNGYAFDVDRAAAFHYRDFVIKAFNNDMPYDEFVRLQVAGDLVTPEDFPAQAATGFLAAGPFTSQQTMKERERSRYEQLDDIVGTLGTSMLGLTIGCARCHDHKFDPVGLRDYYRLIACFEQTGFQDFDWDPDPTGTKTAMDAFNAELQPLLGARTAFENEVLPDRLAAWEKNSPVSAPETKLSTWHHIGPFKAARYDTAFHQQFSPEKQVDLRLPVGTSQWTEQPGWRDGTVHNTLTGENSANYVFRTIEADCDGPLSVSFGSKDGIKVFLNQKPVLVNPGMGPAAADEHVTTLHLNAGRNDLLLKIVSKSGPSGFYFSTDTPPPPENIRNILNLAHDQRNDKQKLELLKWFAPRDKDWSRLDQSEKQHLQYKPRPQITKVFAARQGGTTYNFGDDTRKVYFLARGNSNSKIGRATPAFLQVLMNSDDAEQRWLRDESESAETRQKHARVALGDWLTDTEAGAGHLLARVIVNRLWQHHFGTGIVATPSDFGQQGARPTYPKLLDYLAGKLIEGGWRLKPIHRLILTSAVYRQNGTASKAGLQHDPDNQLWWRQTPRRLEAEIIRDSLLAVSGSLDKRMFGVGSLDEADVRRSVYLKVKRSSLIPLLQLFDAPDAMQSIGNRGVTTVPPQALAMMNSPLIRQLAEKLAARVQEYSGMNSEQIVQYAFWLVLSRPPQQQETEQMCRFIADQAAKYVNEEDSMTVAVADFCQLMLCLNEFVYVD